MKLANTYANATIVKTFEKNGKLYAHIQETCDRCGGKGIYYVAMHNGRGVPAQPSGGVCYKCFGKGKIFNEVRLYTDDEYARMQVQEQKRKQKQEAKRIEELNVALLHKYGFQQVYAYIVLGDTYSIKEQLKEANAKYTPELKSVCPRANMVTTHKYVKVSVADIFTINANGVFELKDVSKLLLTPATSNYLGTVGRSLAVVVTVSKRIPYTSNYGTGIVYVFETTSNKDVVIWRTSGEQFLEFDKTYSLVGTVKEHTQYNGVNQTVLTRCKAEEV